MELKIRVMVVKRKRETLAGARCPAELEKAGVRGRNLKNSHHRKELGQSKTLAKPRLGFGFPKFEAETRK
jgi:hypothetical protein